MIEWIYMSNEYVTVRNLDTRKVGRVRRRIAEHEVFGRNLEIVPEGSKDYVDLSVKVDEFLGREPETVEDLVFLEDFEPTHNYEKEDEA